MEVRASYRQGKTLARAGGAQLKFAPLQARGIWRYALVDSLLISAAIALGGAIAGRSLAASLASFAVAFVIIGIWRGFGWKQQQQEALHEQDGLANGNPPKFYGRLRIALLALALVGPIVYFSMQEPEKKEPREPVFYVVPQAE